MIRCNRRLVIVLLVVGAFACGESKHPAPSPSTPSPAPEQPPPPARPPITLSGVVTATNDNHPLAGVNVGIGTVSTTTDSAGNYSLALPLNAPSVLPYVVSGGNLLPHAGTLNTTQSRAVNLDAIVQDSSFDLAFYRALVRGGSASSQLRRWTTNPNVYVKTIDFSTGLAVEPEVLSLVIDWAQRAVRLWTGDRLQVGSVATGPSDLRDATGWIIVNFFRDQSRNICAEGSFIAPNPGRIAFNIGRCGCGSVKVPPGLVLHEFGHAMGFYDLNDPRSVMYPQIPGGCPVPELTPAEQRHSAIAYHRANGNLDPDIDPDASAFLTP